MKNIADVLTPLEALEDWELIQLEKLEVAICDLKQCHIFPTQKINTVEIRIKSPIFAVAN